MCDQQWSGVGSRPVLAILCGADSASHALECKTKQGRILLDARFVVC